MNALWSLAFDSRSSAMGASVFHGNACKRHTNGKIDLSVSCFGLWGGGTKSGVSGSPEATCAKEIDDE